MYKMCLLKTCTSILKMFKILNCMDLADILVRVQYFIFSLNLIDFYVKLSS